MWAKIKAGYRGDKGYVNQLYAIMGNCKKIQSNVWELLSYREYSFKEVIGSTTSVNNIFQLLLTDCLFEVYTCKDLRAAISFAKCEFFPKKHCDQLPQNTGCV